MVELITDMSAFMTSLNQNNKHTVKFALDGKEYEIVYSELTSAEETRYGKEFERWFMDAYKDEARKEKDVSLQQYRYYKMVAKNNSRPLTFDEFLAMPRTVISAMVGAIEEDLVNRYPHIKRQIDAMQKL